MNKINYFKKDILLKIVNIADLDDKHCAEQILKKIKEQISGEVGLNVGDCDILNSMVDTAYKNIISYFSEEQNQKDIEKIIGKIKDKTSELIRKKHYGLGGKYDDELKHLREYCNSPIIEDYTDLYYRLIKEMRRIND